MTRKLYALPMGPPYLLCAYLAILGPQFPRKFGSAATWGTVESVSVVKEHHGRVGKTSLGNSPQLYSLGQIAYSL